MNDTTLIQVVIFIYISAVFALFFRASQREGGPGRAGALLVYCGLILHTASLVWRWVRSYQLGFGHAPLANRYESLVFFSWCVVLFYVLLERRFHFEKLGGFIILLAAAGIASTSIIPGAEPEIEPLMPALHSNWLFFHVATCFLGYSAFAVAFVCGIQSLIVQGRSEPDSMKIQSLDDMMHHTVAVGFLLLTIGIITGSAWAYNAWGRYWGWDPKEVWSLITWFVYAIFLHARFTKGWTGKRLAWVAIAGFISVLITFLAVNYLSIFKGLHSYA